MRQEPVIFKTRGASVTSLYNGAAYILTLGTGDILLQGDDAMRWREDFDSADTWDAKIDLITRYF